jgi:hypothetical protein
MKRSIAAAGAVSLALFLGACAGTPAATTSSAMAPSSMAPATSAAATSAPATKTSATATTDIVGTAVAAGNFTTLAAALTAAGLVDTLKGAGPYTVFAPSDAAFAKLPAGTVDTLLKDPKGKLSDISSTTWCRKQGHRSRRREAQRTEGEDGPGAEPPSGVRRQVALVDATVTG